MESSAVAMPGLVLTVLHVLFYLIFKQPYEGSHLPFIEETETQPSKLVVQGHAYFK